MLHDFTFVGVLDDEPKCHEQELSSQRLWETIVSRYP